MERIVQKIAIVAAVGMFIVLIMGATVTNTGSAEGCGRSWPLCHGEFKPAYTIQTAIELSHRAVTAVEGVIILAAAAGAIFYRRKQPGIYLFSFLMVFSTILQAGMGAAAVMWPQSPTILATHFGISLVCLASAYLLARLLHEPFDRNAPRAVRPVYPFPTWYRRLAWFSIPATIVVSYVGAYMRHSGNELACYRWPGCTDGVLNTFDRHIAISLAHRTLAVGAMVMVGLLWYHARRWEADQPALARITRIGMIVVIAQSLVGGFVVLTRLDLWTTLAHAGLMALLFVCLCDIIRLTRLPRRYRAPQPVSMLTPLPGRTA